MKSNVMLALKEKNKKNAVASSVNPNQSANSHVQLMIIQVNQGTVWNFIRLHGHTECSIYTLFINQYVEGAHQEVFNLIGIFHK